MATTNKAIIDAYKAANNLPLDSPLYTWGVWRNLGYQVKKGEKCRHRVALYKHTTKKIEQKVEQNFYMNCIDCLRYGYGLSFVPSCGEDKTRRETIWKQAIEDMTAS